MNAGFPSCAKLLTALLIALPLSLPLAAQQSSSSSDDKTPPPQNQSNSSSQSNSNATPPSPADSNAFPEDVSRKAAKQKQQDDSQNQSKPADPQADPKAPDNAGSSDNPFPEETSRKAAADAKAAGSGSSSSGVSSSSDYDDRARGGRNAVVPNVSMSHIHDKDPAKEDIQVGTFYLQTKNFQGAYQRFKEASTLHPENTDAIFGLAEAARNLKKNDEAIANYKLFLDVIDSGSKARDARKALASLEKPH